jgi:hypothetical protein
VTPRRPSARTRRKDPGFAIGDVVDYHSVIGGAATRLAMTIIGGPFYIGDTRCWKLQAKAGVVAEDALSRPVKS